MGGDSILALITGYLDLGFDDVTARDGRVFGWVVSEPNGRLSRTRRRTGQNKEICPCCAVNPLTIYMKRTNS